MRRSASQTDEQAARQAADNLRDATRALHDETARSRSAELKALRQESAELAAAQDQLFNRLLEVTGKPQSASARTSASEMAQALAARESRFEGEVAQTAKRLERLNSATSAAANQILHASPHTEARDQMQNVTRYLASGELDHALSSAASSLMLAKQVRDQLTKMPDEVLAAPNGDSKTDRLWRELDRVRELRARLASAAEQGPGLATDLSQLLEEGSHEMADSSTGGAGQGSSGSPHPRTKLQMLAELDGLELALRRAIQLAGVLVENPSRPIPGYETRTEEYFRRLASPR
jgi:hypothetical protein